MPSGDAALLFSAWKDAYELGMEKPGKSAAYNSELESNSAKENVTSDAAAGASFTRLRGFDTSISPPSLFKTRQPFPSRRICFTNDRL